MFPIVHFLTSFGLFLVLFPFFGFWSFAVFIGGFFIDVDHYFAYTIEKKRFHPLLCYKELTNESVRNKKLFTKRKKRPLYLRWDRLHIFHVWEFVVLIFLLIFLHTFFLLIFLGMILHLSLDFIDLWKERVYGRRALSFFGWLQRRTRK